MLCFAEEVDPSFSGFTGLEYPVWLVILSYNLSSCFAAKRRHEFAVDAPKEAVEALLPLAGPAELQPETRAKPATAESMNLAI